MDFILAHPYILFLPGLLILCLPLLSRHKDEPDRDAEELPRVVISQQVPSVFDTFKGGKDFTRGKADEIKKYVEGLLK